MTNPEKQGSVKKLYCIQYPGNIQNVDRALKTLGGINSVSNAFSNTQRKLELRFRPDNKFCNSASGECCKDRSFLLKVTIKRKKSQNGTEKPTISDVSVVGKVVKLFSFKSLMDYQYLPAEINSEGKFESVYDIVVPKSIVPSSWLEEPAPVFLPPSYFSRIDTVQSYLTLNKTTDNASTLIGRTRDRRSNYVKFVSHDMNVVPAKPNPRTLRYIQTKMVSEEEILRIKELFDERPVWTKHSLAYITKFSNVQIKYLLALRAFHFTSGPFRVSWVKFGYDPRKDPTAVKYQIIDFRIRSNILAALRDLNPHWRFYNPRARAPKSSNNEEINGLSENSYIFKPGFIPPHRQMFYQLCDIKIPEVEKRVNEHIETTTEYDPKYGWLTESIYEFIRDQMDKHIIAVLQSNTPGCSSSNATELLLTRKLTADHESDESYYEDSDQDDTLMDLVVEEMSTNDVDIEEQIVSDQDDTSIDAVKEI